MSSEHTQTRRKHQNWCGTEITDNRNKADQAPVNQKMSAVSQGKRGYPCETQPGVALTFGYPPDNGSGIKRPKIKVKTLSQFTPHKAANQSKRPEGAEGARPIMTYSVVSKMRTPSTQK
ncbi:hypothetical protein QBC37DRAFT_407650 [Rhypophila decipiens]|uniref:Uncharacterized protein n=1 Tax=Rhypophila decipiens TaxID=261697 RepID=A0AAN7AZZ6_9PEZI|nr:hypothetical protein QBC37DRAFT_407650 [Rhypophila decipiens]